MLYMRFVICLAVGLFGLALLMSTMMESVLVDWDMDSDLKALKNRLAQRDRRRYVLIGDGKGQIRLGQSRQTNPAKKAMEKEFLAAPSMGDLRLPVPPPAGPRLKRTDIFAPSV
jgi:hypothetical protein